MNISAAYTFDASPAKVWEVLMDTEAIAGCLPGCRGLRPAGDDRYEAELVAGVAAVSGNFKGTITLKDRHPPDSYRLVMDAAGRPGFVRGEAQVTLQPEGAGTRVEIAATADIGGTMARVGQRLLEGVARMTMDRFYACLAKRVGDAAGSSGSSA